MLKMNVRRKIRITKDNKKEERQGIHEKIKKNAEQRRRKEKPSKY